MEKVCRKSAVKTSLMPLFSFGKFPKTVNACNRILKITYFKVNHEKSNLSFSFTPSPFFMDKIMKTKKAWN